MRNITFAVLLIIPSVLFSQSTHWEWRSPIPQGNWLNDVWAFNESTAVAVGKSSTIMQTYDRGLTWTIQSEIGGTSSTLMGIQFLDDSEGWVVGYDGTIIKTTDGGTTWRVVHTGANQNLTAIYFTDANNGFAVGMRNPYPAPLLLKTTDGGESWTTTTPALSGFELDGLQFVDQQNGWMISHYSVVKTTDGGATWNEQVNIGYFLYDLCFVDDMHGWVVGDVGTIYATTDGGASWHQQFGVIADWLFGVQFVNATDGWAVGGSGQVLRTTDGGDHWDLGASGTSARLNGVHFVNSSVGWVVGVGGTILYTTDGGQSWTSNSVGTSFSLAGVEMMPSGVGWAVGSDRDAVGLTQSGILKTEDNGMSWHKAFSSSRSLMGISFANEKNGWAVGWDGYTCRTTDGGSTWSTLYIQTPIPLLAVQFLHADTNSSNYTGYAVGGMPYDLAATPDAAEKANTIADNPTYGICLKTTNGGASWNTLPVGDTISLQAVSFLTSDVGWIAGNDYGLPGGGFVYKTTDGGGSWETQLMYPDMIYTLQFVDANVGYVAGGTYYAGRILKTTDGGVTWNSMWSTFPTSVRSSYFLTADLGYVGLRNGNIFKTTDGGNSWTDESSPASNALRDMTFLDPTQGFAVGDDGTIIALATERPPEPPRTPATIFPPNNAILDQSSTLLDWVRPRGAEKFRVEVSGDSAFTSLITLDPSVIKTYKQLDGLADKDSYYWRVRGENAVGAGQWSSPKTFKTDFEAVSRTVNAGASWNLLSVPVNVSDPSVSAIFPDAIAPAYWYNPQDGYEPRSVVESFHGYWVEFASPQALFFAGDRFPVQSVPVVEGWNLVGSPADPIPTAGIISDPPGIVVSNFFSYHGSYLPSATLQPCLGYWVKTSAPGTLTFSSSAIAEKQSSTDASTANLNELILNDAQGHSQRLYFGDRASIRTSPEFFVLPPEPPRGAFDVRFGSQRTVEVARNGEKITAPIHVSASPYPVTLQWNVRTGSNATILANGKEIPIEGSGSMRFNSPPEELSLVFRGGDMLPSDIALHQNYPNPFNPATTIVYDIPFDAFVSLRVYNTLGQEVATLAQSEHHAGTYTVVFSGENLSSGVYVCRLSVRDHATGSGRVLMQQRAMVLLK